MSYVLFNESMRFNPKNPNWFNRDRFVLSAGHGSMLQYALMHLVGYDSVSVSFQHPETCTDVLQRITVYCSLNRVAMLAPPTTQNNLVGHLGHAASCCEPLQVLTYVTVDTDSCALALCSWTISSSSVNGIPGLLVTQRTS